MGSPPRWSVSEGKALFFRWVSRAEFKSWQSVGRLIDKPGMTEAGKYLTTSPELAARWGELLSPFEPDDHPGHVLEIRVDQDIAAKFYYIGPRVDGIGPGFLAAVEQLEGAQVQEASHES